MVHIAMEKFGGFIQHSKYFWCTVLLLLFFVPNAVHASLIDNLSLRIYYDTTWFTSHLHTLSSAFIEKGTAMVFDTSNHKNEAAAYQSGFFGGLWCNVAFIFNDDCDENEDDAFVFVPPVADPVPAPVSPQKVSTTTRITDVRVISKPTSVTNVYNTYPQYITNNPTTIVKEGGKESNGVSQTQFGKQVDAIFDTIYENIGDTLADHVAETLVSFTTALLTVTGPLHDSTDSAGANGYILQSTGSGVVWVATSTLGMGGSSVASIEDLNDVAAMTEVTGDVLIWNGSAWINVATSSLGLGGSSGTVSSVNMSVPTGFSISGNPITTTGTLALNYAAGYGPVLTASTTAWENKVSSQWTTSGSNIYYTAGNVGVGTTSPSAAFSLHGTTTSNLATFYNTAGGSGSTAAVLSLQTDSNASYWISFLRGGTQIGRIANSNSDFQLSAIGGSADLIFSTNNTERMRITPAGLVGIGTTTPGSLFSVAGNGFFGGNLTATGTLSVSGLTTLVSASTTNISVSGNSYLGTVLGGTWNGSAIDISGFTNLGVTATGLQLSGDDVALAAGYIIPLSASTTAWQNNVSSQWGTNGSDIYYTGGNVGVGTTTPTSPFHVYSAQGTPFQIQVTTPNSYSDLEFHGTGNSFSMGTGNDAETFYGVANKFYVYDGNADAMRLVIDSTGKVGIGTTSPSAKLDITGLAGSSDIFTISSSTNARLLTVTAGGDLIVGGNATTTGAHYVSGLLRASGGINTLGSSINAVFNLTSSATSGYELLSGDASATAPTLIPNRSDLKAGIGANAAGNVSIIANNGGTATEMLRIMGTSSSFVAGNVGIGTSSPIAKLSIAASAGSSDVFAIASSTGSRILTVAANGNVGIGTTTPRQQLSVGNYLDIYSGGTYTGPVSSIRGTSAGDLFLNAAGTTGDIYFNNEKGRNLILLNGNLGIGTSSPGTRLHVADNSSFGGGLVSALTVSQSSQDGNPTTKISSTYSNAVTLNDSEMTRISNVVTNSSASPSAYMSFWTVNGGSLTEKLRIAEDGNIGIGTTSPAAKLSIVGTAGSSDIFAVSSSTNARLFTVTAAGNVGIGTINPGTKLEIVNGTISEALRTSYSADVRYYHSIFTGYSAVTASNYLAFNVNNGAANAQVEVMRLQGNGSVGIGTVSPVYLLDVASSSGAFHVDSTGLTASSTSNAPYFEADVDEVTLFLGSLGNTSGYTADQSSGNIRFNGGSVQWGDFGYYPTGGDSGEYGHFRFSRTSTNINRIPDAKVGVGSLYSASSIGVGTTTPEVGLSIYGADSFGLLHLTNTSANGAASISFRSADDANGASSQWMIGKNLGGLTSDQFCIWNGNIGCSAMTITTGGNVGIGTTTPATRLEVNGEIRKTNADGYMVFAVQNGNNGLYWDSSGATYGSAGAISLSTQNTARLTVTTAGNVGIGTTTPTSKLAVVGADDQDAGPILMLTGAVANQSEGGRIRFTETSGLYTGGYIHYNAASNTLNIGVHNAQNSLISGDSDAITILRSNGYVGIGTTSPTNKLHLDGGATTSPVALSFSRGGTTTADIGLAAGGSHYFVGAGAGDLNIRTSSTTKINLGSNNGTGTSIPTLTIDRNNLGLGVMTPGSPYGGTAFEIKNSADGGLAGVFIDADDTGYAMLLLGDGGTSRWHVQDDPSNTFSITQSGVADRITILSTNGRVGLSDADPNEAELVIGSSGAGNLYFTPTTTGTTNNAVCWDNSGATLLYDCDSTPADYAESYPTANNVTFGHIVMATTEQITQTDGEKVPKLIKAVEGQGAVIGITSNNYHDFTSAASDLIGSQYHPLPVALNGRVPVKVNLEGGTINVGDKIALSSVPGIGKKAEQSGETIVGTALAPFTTESGSSTVLVFVANGVHTTLAENARARLFELDLDENPDVFAELLEGQPDTIWTRLTKLAQGFKDGVLSVVGIHADQIDTDKLCIGETCVSEDELKALLEGSNHNTPTPTPSPSSEPEAEGSEIIEDTPEGGEGTEEDPEVEEDEEDGTMPETPIEETPEDVEASSLETENP